ncbi:MAG: amylo-alpha-1,6-glucosidase [Desulfobacterales bacterium]
MNPTDQLIQSPAPGSRLVKFCGDTVEFKLSLPHAMNGKAWVRTTIGHARTIRKEIIALVNSGERPLGRAWYDIPMQRVDEGTFAVKLPLCECGHFEAKCFFLPENETAPIWPPGPNTAFNVDTADACCANIIYNAFVRQFGPGKAAAEALSPSETQLVEHLDQIGYTVIPRSGTFRDLIAELDFILGELGCRILMLLPIHPTPTTYGRMGRFGSPYAALSFTAVDPALAVFDPHATPLEQFVELVDAVHQRNASIFIDIAINHTGWAAGLHESHPHWLARNPEGKIEVPGAWGVNWEDLTKLDYNHKDLWQYMAEVFLTWCNRGVDGFRCDAGYMIPQAAWQYMVARVREEYPDTIFLLEGLGGKIAVTRDLLNSAGLNWAYSELFQNYDRGQIENYLPETVDISKSDGITVHFAETHDNPRLASRSRIYARMRTALCALASPQGAFGFANGVEWYAAEKINVHNSPSLNWGAVPNQVAHIRRLNDLLKMHPAFYGETELQMVQEGAGNYIALLRHHKPTGKRLLVLVNLDDRNPTVAGWNRNAAGMSDPQFFDLLSETEAPVIRSEILDSCPLEPGQVLCLTQDEKDVDVQHKLQHQTFGLPAQIELQRLHAKALEVFSFYHGTGDLAQFDIESAVRQLKQDPVGFCRDLNPDGDEPRVIIWQWPQDLRREVMIPPGHFLCVQADCAFRARLISQNHTIYCEKGLVRTDGTFFALFAPVAPPECAQPCTLKLAVYAPAGGQHEKAALLLLPQFVQSRVKQTFSHAELLQGGLTFLGTNGRGAMLKVPVGWGSLNSRYDCLLAANISREFPEDRWIMFTRCRGWLVFQGYSQDLDAKCLEAFGVDDAGRGLWRFHVPAGQGQNILFTLGLKMPAGKNAVQMTFYRHSSRGKQDHLADSKPVQLILRPDIENRSFHETTKAYLGPEAQWPQKVIAAGQGFDFSPDARHHLRISLSEGQFVWEPEWQYMVYRPREAERGQDPDSDLFSPGYFSVFLEGNQQICLSAEINPADESESLKMQPGVDQHAGPLSLENNTLRSPKEILSRALDDFVVQRGANKSVIAGYPWFLDWGRDALIFVRGLIAARRMAEARSIIRQFGQFEQQGTLPNMIHGQEAANRDTSDAPLWFIVACDEVTQAEKSSDFLEADCNGRSIRRILLSIGQAIVDGIPNGIRMDPATGLVFSPPHFTWMDTNYPAGTPREGYPIEIQALWYAALVSLAKVDHTANRDKWRQISRRVQASILNLYLADKRDYLCDCLHATAGQTAAQATDDDALRPNQLLAITLGAVRDKPVCRRILASCEALLVPGAIRSLADKPVAYPIEIIHQGKIISDPHHPYRGQYCGDEDTNRKPAYHNGTAWTWLFPSFCEAWAATYGAKSRETALALLAAGFRLLEQGCAGHIPEILDGDFPHTLRGCDAQAWGASELLRVMLKLT